MNSKIILAFFGGAAISAFVTYKITVALCERQIEEEMNLFLEELDRQKYQGEEQKDISDMTDEEYEERTGTVMRKYCPGTAADDARKNNMIFRKPDLNKTAYHAIIRSDTGRVMDVINSSSDDIEPIQPVVITMEEFTDSHTEYEKLSLYYWDEDDTLSDEGEEIIPNIEDFIGDALTHFGEGSNDPDIVYVRNERLGCDYEVVRQHKSFQQEVYGIPPEEGNNKKRRMKDDQHISKDD